MQGALQTASSEISSLVTFSINLLLPTNLTSFFSTSGSFLVQLLPRRPFPPPFAYCHLPVFSDPPAGLGAFTESLPMLQAPRQRRHSVRMVALSQNPQKIPGGAGLGLHLGCKGVLSPEPEAAGIPSCSRPEWRPHLPGTRGSALAVPGGMTRRCTLIWLRW